MPPKKKGKGKGKGKGKKKKDESRKHERKIYKYATLELEDKYKRTMDEIEALKDHLALRKELTRHAQSASAQIYERMAHAEQMFQEQVDDQKAISADMTRQYKTMQTEMGLRIHQLETELGKMQAQLDFTKHELQQAREERDRTVKVKDEEISELKMKVSSMEKAYETILREALDGLMAKIDLAHDAWEAKSTNIQGKTKQALLEFGLNPLDI